MAITQKLIRELTDTYLPDAADNFSNIFLAVDSSTFGADSQKMPLSVLFSAATHVESGVKTFTGTTYTHVYADEGEDDFLDSNYRLDLKIYKIDSSNGNTYKTLIQPINETQTTTGFTFELLKDYGATTIYVDYKAETR